MSTAVHSPIQTRKIDDKDYVLCAWRKKFVRLTPEEWIRQTFLHQLVEKYHYPTGRIAVEVPLKQDKRADAIVYDAHLHPWMLMEFKREHVTLTQNTLDQAAVYNRELEAPYLVLCNGKNIVIARVSATDIQFLTDLPEIESID